MYLGLGAIIVAACMFPACIEAIGFYSVGCALDILLFISGAGGGTMTLLGVWNVKIELTRAVAGVCCICYAAGVCWACWPNMFWMGAEDSAGKLGFLFGYLTSSWGRGFY